MNVNGLRVRIVESHEDVLTDWAEAARDAGRALTLVTLDRHLDTAPALSAELAEDGADAEDADARERRRRRVLARFRGARPEDLEPLVARLRNDEHVDAALRLGILDRVLIVSSQAGRTDDAPLPGTSVFRPECAPDCPADAHGGAACQRRRYDAMLESALLGPALAHLAHDPARAPYVLDVDLDTFATRRGLAPSDPTAFHALIAGACMVTIAREPEYVNESLDDHDADEIEAAVLRHVAQAASTR